MKRPLCKQCNEKPRAYAYKLGTKIYWRSKCDTCIRRQNKQKTDGIPKWYKQGYRQKSKCELCGFRSKHKVQFNVYHVDGNRNNCSVYNLKTICANCQRITQKSGVRWKQGDLRPDF